MTVTCGPAIKYGKWCLVLGSKHHQWNMGCLPLCICEMWSACWSRPISNLAGVLVIIIIIKNVSTVPSRDLLFYFLPLAQTVHGRQDRQQERRATLRAAVHLTSTLQCFGSSRATASGPGAQLGSLHLLSLNDSSVQCLRSMNQTFMSYYWLSLHLNCVCIWFEFVMTCTAGLSSHDSLKD